MTHFWTTYESPLGALTLSGRSDRLTAVHFPGHGGERAEEHHRPDLFADAVTQLEEYFAGSRCRFDLPLHLGGTPFQQAVWRELLAIPYGETRSYSEIAHLIGRPDRIRAVGGAVGATPVPIIVPCHRVIGSDGALTGYGGGLHRKRMLLELEHAVSHGDPAPAVWTPRQLSLL